MWLEVDNGQQIRQRLMIKVLSRTTAAVSSAMRPEAHRVSEQVRRVPKTHQTSS